MTITDAIEELHGLLDQHGDLEMAFYDGSGGFIISPHYRWGWVNLVFPENEVIKAVILLDPKRPLKPPPAKPRHLRLVK